MNTPEINQFIKENNALFWYIPDEKKENIDNEVLVEVILNYGDKNAVQKYLRDMHPEVLNQNQVEIKTFSNSI